MSKKKSFIEHPQTVAKINVTPIIDVALVLVIILMVTAPMIAVSDVDVNLPPAQTRSVESDQRVTITLGSKGELAVDDTDVSARELPAVLAKHLAEKDGETVVVIRADEKAQYARVQSLIEDAKAAGGKRIAIATRQRGDRYE